MYPFDLPRLIELCRQNDVSMASIFGSMASGESKKKSDIDLLVRFPIRKSLLAVVRLERELFEALGRKVDLLTEAALSPYLRERIMKELQVIYKKDDSCDTIAVHLNKGALLWPRLQPSRYDWIPR